MKFFKNLRNEIDFFFRSHIRLSREYKGKNESKENLFKDLNKEKVNKATEKEAIYFEKYCLQYLKNNSTRRNYLENLEIIELLESLIMVDIKQPRILDIGSKNWFYAPGEYNFFKYNGFEKQIYLDGLEIDAYRVYADFHTRYDYAQNYIKDLKDCQYLTKNLLEHSEKYDYITWFYPFLTEIPVLAWGLPLRVLKPLQMLKHASSLLKPGGTMVIVNQNKKEYAIQEDLLRKLNLNYKGKNEFDGSFLEDNRGKHVIIISKFGI